MEADANTHNKTLGRGWESWRRGLERLIIRIQRAQEHHKKGDHGIN